MQRRKRRSEGGSMPTLRFSVSHNFYEGAERVRALIPRATEAMLRVAQRGSEEIEDSYRDLINKDTGRTATTIGKVVVPHGTGGTGYIGSDDKIAIILEYGSRAHVIEPSAKKALFGPGFAHPVANVRHPGTPEYAPLLRAAMGSIFEVERIAIDEVEDVFGSV